MLPRLSQPAGRFLIFLGGVHENNLMGLHHLHEITDCPFRAAYVCAHHLRRVDEGEAQIYDTKTGFSVVAFMDGTQRHTEKVDMMAELYFSSLAKMRT